MIAVMAMAISPSQMQATFNPDTIQWSASATTSFGLIFLAEMGDKFQLVCMTLAPRYAGRPVLWGSIAAFVL